MKASALHPATRWYALPDGFALEQGAHLDGGRLAYRCWGQPSSRAVLVCHALTGSADVEQWWPGIIGPGCMLDPAREFIVCCNVLGSCYGSTGPAAPHPHDGAPYGARFPAVTLRDMVRAQALLLDALGIEQLSLVIGGSLGGMQALEWAIGAPDRVEAAVVIAASAQQPAWAIALSSVQRAAVRLDDGDGGRGLAVARMAAICSYRHWQGFERRFGRQPGAGDFAVNDYLAHHGRRFVGRFDRHSYLALIDAMDSHDVARQRGALEAVLAACPVRTLLIGIDSDLLYPPVEQRRLAMLLPHAHYAEIQSPHGHDAFLIETAAIVQAVRRFRQPAPHPAIALQFSY
ncbi:MAG: homoserine O-acetyltransferase [Solimonas sp.]